MQVANTREDSVEDVFCVTFGLVQVEMEGSFKIPHTSYIHIHKHDTVGFNVKKLKQFICKVKAGHSQF